MDFMPKNTTPPVEPSAPQVADEPTAQATPSDSLQAWIEHKKRTAGVVADRAAGALDEQQQNVAPVDDQGGGLNHEDEWDRPGAVQQPKPEADVDPMAQFRRGEGYRLEAPTNGIALDESAVSDFGFVAKHVGLTPDAAQTLVATFAGVGETERRRLVGAEGGYDPDLTVSELRFEFGTELEPTLAKIEKLCAKHPSLATYLDTTGLGNSPEVLRMLAGAATVGTTPGDARAFIAAVKKDSKHGYWKGNKLALAQMRWAYAIAGE